MQNRCNTSNLIGKDNTLSNSLIQNNCQKCGPSHRIHVTTTPVVTLITLSKLLATFKTVIGLPKLNFIVPLVLLTKW